MDQPAAVGRLAPDGDWVGLRRRRDRYDLVVGRAGLILTARRATPDEVLLTALVYFSQALQAPPPEAEATHADMADAVRWLAEHETDASRAELLRRAVDAIDDGLAGDEVMSRLAAALPAAWRDRPASVLGARATATLAAS
ncbi:MAG: hypothetical protein ACRDGJ_09085 [Candidatus Limnocylindria bacterium]